VSYWIAFWHCNSGFTERRSFFNDEVTGRITTGKTRTVSQEVSSVQSGQEIWSIVLPQLSLLSANGIAASNLGQLHQRIHGQLQQGESLASTKKQKMEECGMKKLILITTLTATLFVIIFAADSAMWEVLK
jgi:hypothetical protein